MKLSDTLQNKIVAVQCAMAALEERHYMSWRDKRMLRKKRRELATIEAMYRTTLAEARMRGE